MRIVVQRAKNAKCIVDNKIVGQINHGYMLLVGFTEGDSCDQIQYMAKKVIGLRIFEDEMGKLNKSITDVDGAILAISQFTLYADAKKGNRPSFINALHYEEANILFMQFVSELKKYDLQVETGVFGADMEIDFINVGPTTILLDSKELM